MLLKFLPTSDREHETPLYPEQPWKADVTCWVLQFHWKSHHVPSTGFRVGGNRPIICHKIHWPTKSHCSTVLAFLKLWRQWMDYFQCVLLLSLIHGIFLHQPSDSVGCPTCSNGQCLGCPVILRQLLHHVIIYWCYRVSFRRLSEWRACTCTGFMISTFYRLK